MQEQVESFERLQSSCREKLPEVVIMRDLLKIVLSIIPHLPSLSFPISYSFLSRSSSVVPHPSSSASRFSPATFPFSCSFIPRLSSLVFLFFLSMSPLLSGCGYTNRAMLPNNIRSIAIPPFANKIPPGQVFTYEPGIEIDVTEKVIKRILFDGNLKVTKLEKADARLEGELIHYYQEGTRFNSQEGVSEYRLYVVCHLRLIDQRNNEVIWDESAFSGDTEYFIEGSNAKPERTAVDSAIDDLAKNVVNRIVEDW